MRRVSALLLALASLWLLHGCGEDEASGSAPPDAALDVVSEPPADAGADADAAEEGPVDADASGEAEASPEADATLEDSMDAGLEASSDAAGDADAGAKLGVMSLAELVALLPTKSFLLINVHVPYAGEIPKTDKNLSYQDVSAIESFVGANKNVEVVLYCYANTMAILAGNALVANGYANVRYMDGGLAAWKNAGYGVEFHDY